MPLRGVEQRGQLRLPRRQAALRARDLQHAHAAARLALRIEDVAVVVRRLVGMPLDEQDALQRRQVRVAQDQPPLGQAGLVEQFLPVGRRPAARRRASAARRRNSASSARSRLVSSPRSPKRSIISSICRSTRKQGSVASTSPNAGLLAGERVAQQVFPGQRAIGQRARRHRAWRRSASSARRPTAGPRPRRASGQRTAPRGPARTPSWRRRAARAVRSAPTRCARRPRSNCGCCRRARR